MMQWIIARFTEKTTLFGLPAIIAVSFIGWVVMRFYFGIHLIPQHYLAPVGAGLVTLLTPDSAARKIALPILEYLISSFNGMRPSAGEGRPAPIPRKGVTPMSKTFFSELAADVPDLIAVIEDGMTLVKQAEADLAGKTPLQMIGALSALAPAAEKFGADLAKVVADIKAIGAAEAAGSSPGTGEAQAAAPTTIVDPSPAEPVQ